MSVVVDSIIVDLEIKIREHGGTAPARPSRRERELRDLFLLAKLLPGMDRPALTGMVYDAVVAEIGPPGTGYDPAYIRHCRLRHVATQGKLLDEIEKNVPAEDPIENEV